MSFLEQAFETLVSVLQQTRLKLTNIQQHLKPDQNHAEVSSEVKKEFRRIQKTKMPFQYAVDLKRKLQEVKVESISNEDMREVEQEIERCRVWREKAKNFVNNNLFTLESDLTEEIVREVVGEVNALRDEWRGLLLSDEETEDIVFAFEWEIHARLMIAEVRTTEDAQMNIERMKNLLAKISKCKTIDLTETEFYKEIQSVVEITYAIERIDQKWLKLKTSQFSNKLSLKEIRRDCMKVEELKTILGRIEKSRQIEDFFSSEIIRNLLDEISKMKFRFEEVCFTTKTLLSTPKFDCSAAKQLLEDIRMLLEDMYMLPVCLEPEEKYLEETLSGLHRQYQENVDEYQMLGLAKGRNEEEFKSLNVQSDDFREATFNNFFKENKIKNSFRLLGENTQEMETNTRQIYGIQFSSRNSMNSQEDFGRDNEMVILDMKLKWRVKVKSLERLRLGVEILFTPTKFAEVKQILQEGYYLVKVNEEIKEELREDLSILERMILEVEEFVQNVHEQQEEYEGADMHNMDLIWKGFIDIREEIVQLGVLKALGKNYESIVIKTSLGDGRKKKEKELPTRRSSRKKREKRAEELDFGEIDMGSEAVYYGNDIWDPKNKEFKLLNLEQNELEFSNESFGPVKLQEREIVEDKIAEQQEEIKETRSRKGGKKEKGAKKENIKQNEEEEKKDGKGSPGLRSLLEKRPLQNEPMTVGEIIEIEDGFGPGGKGNNKDHMLQLPTKKLKTEDNEGKVVWPPIITINNVEATPKGSKRAMTVKEKRRTDVRKQLADILNSMDESLTDKRKKIKIMSTKVEAELCTVTNKILKDYERKFEQLYSFLLEVSQDKQKKSLVTFELLKEFLHREQEDAGSMDLFAKEMQFLHTPGGEEKEFLSLPEAHIGALETSNSTPNFMRRSSFTNTAEHSPYQGSDANNLSMEIENTETKGMGNCLNLPSKHQNFSFQEASENNDKNLQRITLNIPQIKKAHSLEKPPNEQHQLPVPLQYTGNGMGGFSGSPPRHQSNNEDMMMFPQKELIQSLLPHFSRHASSPPNMRTRVDSPVLIVPHTSPNPFKLSKEEIFQLLASLPQNDREEILQRFRQNADASTQMSPEQREDFEPSENPQQIFPQPEADNNRAPQVNQQGGPFMGIMQPNFSTICYPQFNFPTQPMAHQPMNILLPNQFLADPGNRQNARNQNILQVPNGRQEIAQAPVINNNLNNNPNNPQMNTNGFMLLPQANFAVMPMIFYNGAFPSGLNNQ